MKRIAGLRWGASRDLLLRYYMATVRAKIVYSSSIYGSASSSTLAQLDTIQNAALRVSMGAMNSSPILSLHAESGVLPLADYRKQLQCQHYHRIMSLPPSHPLSILYANPNVDQDSPTWVPQFRQPLLVRALQTLHLLQITPPPPQPTRPHSPIPPWQNISHMFALHVPHLPDKTSAGLQAAPLFLELDRSLYHHHIKLYTDGSHSPTPLATSAALYDPATSICRTWRLPAYTDIVTAEMYAIHQALTHLHINYMRGEAVLYTDSLSSLHLLLSRHPTSSTTLVHTIQHTLLDLHTQGWKITLQWIPSHSNIRGNEVVDAAAKMALSEVNITPLPLSLSTATHLITHKCYSTWDGSLADALRTTTMGKYCHNSSPQPWMRKKSRVLDVALTHLRLGHTRLTTHLYRLGLTKDPFCP